MPPALAALDPGGTLAVAGIHLTDIPPLDYEQHLFQERVLRSVTANTRDDGREVLATAARIGMQVTTTRYRFDQADQALRDLAHDRVTGCRSARRQRRWRARRHGTTRSRRDVTSVSSDASGFAATGSSHAVAVRLQAQLLEAGQIRLGVGRELSHAVEERVDRDLGPDGQRGLVGRLAGEQRHRPGTQQDAPLAVGHQPELTPGVACVGPGPGDGRRPAAPWWSPRRGPLAVGLRIAEPTAAISGSENTTGLSPGSSRTHGRVENVVGDHPCLVVGPRGETAPPRSRRRPPTRRRLPGNPRPPAHPSCQGRSR